MAGSFQHCPAPSLWVGDEVSVFDPDNEATLLQLSDPDVLFPRQKTVMLAERVFWTAAGFGELVLDEGCLKLDEHPIIWPAGFTPHVEDGVVEVRNGAGRTVARVGDEIAGGGGYYQGGSLGCRGEVFRIYGIKVLPDVEVYFPKQDGTLAEGRRYSSFTGELAVNGKCLEAEDVVRVSDGSEVMGPVLLIWPATFELRTGDGAAEILDSTGGLPPASATGSSSTPSASPIPRPRSTEGWTRLRPSARHPTGRWARSSLLPGRGDIGQRPNRDCRDPGFSECSRIPLFV